MVRPVQFHNSHAGEAEVRTRRYSVLHFFHDVGQHGAGCDQPDVDHQAERHLMLGVNAKLSRVRTTTVSSKGQVTIPAALLRELDLQPGTQLLVVPVRDGVMLVRPPDSAAGALAGSVRDVYGDPQEYVDAERTSWI